MAAITIDDTARFVCVLSFKLGTGDVAAMSRELQLAVERSSSNKKGFIGCVVMLDSEKSDLSVLSIWESAHAWSEAQYDQEIGRVIADVVGAAKSYSVRTYETIAVVRG